MTHDNQMPEEIYLSPQFGGTVGFEPFPGGFKYVRADLPHPDTALADKLAEAITGIRNRAEHKYSDPVMMILTLQRITEEAEQALSDWQKARGK